MATGVCCENCANFEECNLAMLKLGVKTYVYGMRDCDNYEEKEDE